MSAIRSLKHLSFSRDDCELLQSFRARVRTYLPLTWFNKPTMLSPLECARFGWKCDPQQRDLLHCEACGARLDCRIDSRLTVEGMHAMAIRLHGELQTAHSEQCLWRHAACPEQFARALPAAPSDADDAFAARSHTFPALLSLRPSNYEGLISPDDVASVLQNDDRTIFAVFGWRYRFDGEPIVCCDTCQRTLSCRAFQTVKCVDDHRYFCPWVREAAWKELLEIVKRSCRPTSDADRDDIGIHRVSHAVEMVRKLLPSPGAQRRQRTSS